MHWVISVRLEGRGRALLGSNLTRDIQVEGAPKVHPASGGRRSPEAIFGPPSDTRVIPPKIPRRSRVFHRVLVAYCRQFTTMRTLFPDEPFHFILTRLLNLRVVVSCAYLGLTRGRGRGCRTASPAATGYTINGNDTAAPVRAETRHASQISTAARPSAPPPLGGRR